MTTDTHILQALYTRTYFIQPEEGQPSPSRGIALQCTKEEGEAALEGFNKTGAFIFLRNGTGHAFLRGEVMQVQLMSRDDFNKLTQSQGETPTEASSEEAPPET